MARKKKESYKKDKYGSKFTPYRTDNDLLADYGTVMVREYNEKREKAIKFAMRVITLGVVVSAVSAPIFATQARMYAKQSQQNYEASFNPAFKTKYDDLGKSVLYSYFAHLDSPINLMGDVDWPTDTDESSIDKTDNASLQASPVSVEDITFVSGYQQDFSVVGKKIQDPTFSNPTNEVLTYQGRIGKNSYRFTVSLIIPNKDSEHSHPFLADVPSVAPQSVFVSTIEQSTIASPEGVDGATPTKLSPESVEMIARWANAYAQNDGGSLKQFTGDQEQGWQYMGLGGFRTSSAPVVEWAYEIGEPGGKAPVEGQEYYTYVKIKVQLIPGISRTSDGRAPDPINQTYYLMMTNSTQANPQIVDWGGNWRSLTKYGSAISLGDTGSKFVDESKLTENKSEPTSSTKPKAGSGGKIADLPDNVGAPLEEGVHEGVVEPEEPQPETAQ